MTENKFTEQFTLWKNEVANDCHKFAQEINVDFYPFQSQVTYKPKLMIVGANPSGTGEYGEKHRTSDDLFNCGVNGENAYIAYADDPDWKINKPILKLFSTPKMRNILEQSVIMNAVYFNTQDIDNLKNTDKSKEIIDFCTKKTKELIYDIVKPENVLYIGFDAPKWVDVSVNPKDNCILRHSDGKTALIMATQISDINHYVIHHSSRNFKFNNDESIKLKREKFEELFL